MIFQVSEGSHTEDMTVGLATKWESLCLVPERSVEGLVTRRWDKGNVRKPNMNIKKCKVLYCLCILTANADCP